MQPPQSLGPTVELVSAFLELRRVGRLALFLPCLMSLDEAARLVPYARRLPGVTLAR
jgi:hypothetical protein